MYIVTQGSQGSPYTMYPSPLCLVVVGTGYTVWFHVDTVHVIDTFTLSSQRVTLGDYTSFDEKEITTSTF